MEWADTPYTFMTTRAKIGRKTKDEEQNWGESGSKRGSCSRRTCIDIEHKHQPGELFGT